MSIKIEKPQSTSSCAHKKNNKCVLEDSIGNLEYQMAQLEKKISLQSTVSNHYTLNPHPAFKSAIIANS